MKNKKMKIIASLVLILVMLMPYIQVIANTAQYYSQSRLGAAGDVKILKSKAFNGGPERTGRIPESNTMYDMAGYNRYVTSVSNDISAPDGAGTGEIFIRDIAGVEGTDDWSAFYCLDPTKPFPAYPDGTEYISHGRLDEMTDSELQALIHKPLTVSQLQTLINKFYIKENTQIHPIISSVEKYLKDNIVNTLVDDYNTEQAIYEHLTDDDIKVAQQWALWNATSDARLSDPSILKRDLNGTNYDDTPFKDGFYKSARNAYLHNLVDEYDGQISVPLANNASLTTDLSHVLFEDEGQEYVDYGMFRINTTVPSLMTSIRIYDQNDIDITDTNDYEIYLGEKQDMGDHYATLLSGNLLDNFSNPLLMNREFFLRFNNPDAVAGVRLVVSFIREFITDAEIYEAVDPGFQNVVQIERRPDFDKMEASYFRKDSVSDLALRKFITHINGVEVDSRVPVVTEVNEAIEKDTQTTAHYAHKKNPLVVDHGDTVTYKMRVYNESTIDGHLISIVDVLPKGLSLKTGPGINTNWSVADTLSDGRNVLLYTPSAAIQIPGAVKDGNDNYNMSFVDSITVDLLVDLDAPTGLELTNIAFINEQGEYDIDSKPGSISKDGSRDIFNIDNSLLPSYRGCDNDSQTLDQPNRHYKGCEDDDDFEKVILRPFDLALRKFITKINNTNHNRAPVPNVDGLINGTRTTAEYVHPKDSLQVELGDLVTYTIRVYNEGGIAGYVKQIKDHLPSGLGYVVNHRTNLDQEWSVDGSKAVLTDSEKQAMPFLTRVDLSQIASKTGENTYDASESAISALEIDIVKGEVGIVTEIMENQLLPAFNSAQGAAGLSYVDVEVVSIVLEEFSGMNLRNWAEITQDEDVNGNPGRDRDSTPGNLPDHPNGPYEDDEDYEDLMTQYFDLALRKFITNVNDDGNPNTSGDAVDREPRVDVTPLINETGSTAIYTHPKTPVDVQVGDLVTYRIRVYNEGMMDGYVTDIKDHLPKGLAFLPQHTKNIDNGWAILSGTDSTAADYPNIDFKFREEDLQGVTNLDNVILAVGSPLLSTQIRNNDLIPKFDSTLGEDGLSYVDVEIVAVVMEEREFDSNNQYTGNLRNWAEIADDANEEKNPIIDRDSEPNNWDNHPNGPYEDDEDFEDLTTKPLRFDLALRKFITKVDSESDARKLTAEDLAGRVPRTQINNGQITYVHDKTPPIVAPGDIVEYTIRVYNEGDISGFAKKVRDTIPEGLTYLPNNDTNLEYQWYFIDEAGNVVDDIEDAKYIETEYLSRDAAMQREANGEQPDVANTLIKAFDKNGDVVFYRDIKIVFRVNENAKPGANNLKNIAEISDHEDEDGNDVEDIDSTPGNNEPGEDDIDEEDLKVTFFDLALLKIVTNVEITENGVTKNINTGHTFDMIPEPIVKTDLDERYIDTTTIKYTYKIRVYNEGEVAGYATEVSDYIPEGLEFHEEDQKNNTWTKVTENHVVTNDLADVRLEPGEYATVEIVLRWINHKNNMGVKTNVAEISKDHNDHDLPDIDSVPGNRKPGEDDIDDASVLVAIRTGAAETFFTISLTMAIIVGAGTVLIKRFVL